MQTSRHFRRLDHKRAGPAHRINQRFAAVIATFPQEHRRQIFAHGCLAHGLFVAAFVQAFTRCIDAEGAKVVVDPQFKPDRCISGNCCAQLFDQRLFYTLDCRARMIYFRGFASRLDLHRHIGAQHVAPGELARPFIQLRQMESTKFTDTGQHTPRPAHLQIGAPDLGPIALHGDTPRRDDRVGETTSGSFFAQGVFKAGGSHQEDIEHTRP